jgi:type II secretory pathway pseudopilin PulG
MNKDQEGMALIESLLIILILAIIGFGGYYVWHSQKQTDKTLDTVAKISQSTVSAPAETLSVLTLDMGNGKTLQIKAPKGWSQVQGFNNKVERTIGEQLYVVSGQINDQDFLKLDSYQSNFNGTVGSAKTAKGTAVSIIKLDPDNGAKEGNLALSSCEPDQSGFGCSLDLKGSSLLVLVSGAVGGQTPASISFSGSSFDQFINELQRIIRSMPI